MRLTVRRRAYALRTAVIETLELRQLLTGTWTTLAHAAPGSVGTMLLLPNGSVMTTLDGDGAGADWGLLTPDATGSYVNGTWTKLAQANYTRLFDASQVLPDGRVFVAGGEYGNGAATGEVYSPITNTWTKLPTQSFGSIIDAESVMLPNGNVLISPVAPSPSGYTTIFNPSTNTWSQGPKLYRGGSTDEQGFVKLADDSIITIDSNSTSERYIPSLNQWINDGTVPVAMFDGLGELGAGLRLSDGRAFYLGATGKTAIYTPTGTTSPGTWVAGPTIPGGLGTDDAPAAMLPDGRILCVAGPTGTYNGPTSFFIYDPIANSFSTVTGAPSISGAPFLSRMLSLPNGDVLYTSGGSTLYQYAPGTTPLTIGQPTITSLTPNSDGSITLTGTQINGIDAGSAYGDDAQMDSNYPIVSLASGSSVYYATTSNWSSTSIATGTTSETTKFILPLGIPAGTYSVTVEANGIASAATSLTISTTANNLAPTVATAAAVSASPVVGTTATLSVLGADDAGESNLTYTWTTTSVPSGASLPSFSINGTNASKSTVVTFSKYGSYSFKVTITDAGGLSTTSTVSATVNQTETSMSLTPAKTTITSGGTAQFSASALDQFGAAMASQPGFTWSVIAGAGTVSASGKYTAPSTGTLATVQAADAKFSKTSQVGVVVSPWASQDIGSVGIVGIASNSGGTFTVSGSGSDIWGTSDQFRYVYQTMTGNGTLTARVVSQSSSAAWAKVGVMIRNSLSASDQQAMMCITPSNGAAFQYRTTSGGASTNVNTTGFVAPYWVRLVRNGTTITGYRSVDGQTWVQEGTATIAMGSTVYAGLEVDAYTNSALNTVTFDNISIMSTSTTLTSNANPAVFGQAVTLTATVGVVGFGSTNIPTGTVTFMDGSTTLGTGTLNASGVATYTTSSLSVASHSITATYGGDINFTGERFVGLDSDGWSGGDLYCHQFERESFAAGPVGNADCHCPGHQPRRRHADRHRYIHGRFNHARHGHTQRLGNCHLFNLFPAQGTHSITATYGGSTNYAGSTSSTLSQSVSLASSSSALASSINPSVFGQSVTFTATVTSTSPGTPTGTVTFKDGSATLGAGTLNGSGVATFSTSTLSVASHSITASYGGDSNFSSSVSSTLGQTVDQAATTVALGSSANPSLSSQSVTFTATVTVTSPGAGTPSGTVTFMDGSSTLGTGTLNASGVATYSTSSLAVGSHSITATYGGSTNYAGSASSTLSQSVNLASSSTALASSINPSDFGQSVTFTATVTSTSPGTPTGTVTFKDHLITLGTGTLNASGVATFTTSSLSVASHSISAHYGGDSNFSTSASSTLTQTVNQAGTTVALGSSANPAVLGQSVTLTATVAVSSPGTGTPTGTVTFKDGSSTLGTGTLNASGVATYSTSSLTQGAHSITASYGGNTNYAGSTSSTLSQSVNLASSSTALASSINPSVFGQSVTFTATVTSTSPGTPTGTVAFNDGTTTLSSASLNGQGVATFTTSSLSIASHAITATYQGDGNFAVSVSSTLSQAVTNGPPFPGTWTQTVDFNFSTMTTLDPRLTPHEWWNNGPTMGLGQEMSDPNNVVLSGGALNLYAKLDNSFGTGWTGSLVQTSGVQGDSSIPTFSFLYGYAQATIKVPAGQGLWPAFWMLPESHNDSNGEVDTLELLGNDPTTAYQVVHRNGVYEQHDIHTIGLSQGFHTYGVDWEPGSETFYVDGQVTAVLSNTSLISNEAACLILDLAVGGSWAGPPNATTPSPADMQVSDIQVWQHPLVQTTTTISDSPNPSITTQSVNLTVSVAGGVPDGETVQVEDGSSDNMVVASGALTNGSATLTVPAGTLSAGSHDLFAVYGGDAHFLGSVSSGLTQTVGMTATSTTLNSSANPSVFGQSVTLTAAVLATSPGTGTPTGTVTFSDASGILGTGTLDGSGIATFSTSTLPAGSYSILATYGGDTNYAGSQSAAVSQAVNAASVAVTSVVVNGDNAALAGVQRSMVNSIEYTFSEAVTLAAANAFTIAVHSGQSGTVPTLNWTPVNPDASGASTQWVVTFGGAGVTPGGSIADGVYDITLNTAAVTSEADPTATVTARAADTFYRLYGDALGNAASGQKISNTDNNLFLSTFGLKSGATGYLAYFNEDGSTKIDNTDYNIFLANFGEKFTGFTATI